jgi:hypothetical protein
MGDDHAVKSKYTIEAREKHTQWVVEKDTYLANNPDSVAHPKNKAKKKTDEHGLKRPVNAYMLYNQDVNGSVRTANPELKFTEVCVKIGETWRAMDSDHPVKAKWTELAEANKQEYKVKVKEAKEAKEANEAKEGAEV